MEDHVSEMSTPESMLSNESSRAYVLVFVGNNRADLEKHRSRSETCGAGLHDMCPSLSEAFRSRLVVSSTHARVVFVLVGTADFNCSISVGVIPVVIKANETVITSYPSSECPVTTALVNFRFAYPSQAFLLRRGTVRLENVSFEVRDVSRKRSVEYPEPRYLIDAIFEDLSGSRDIDFINCKIVLDRGIGLLKTEKFRQVSVKHSQISSILRIQGHLRGYTIRAPAGVLHIVVNAEAVSRVHIHNSTFKDLGFRLDGGDGFWTGIVEIHVDDFANRKKGCEYSIEIIDTRFINVTCYDWYYLRHRGSKHLFNLIHSPRLRISWQCTE